MHLYPESTMSSSKTTTIDSSPRTKPTTSTVSAVLDTGISIRVARNGKEIGEFSVEGLYRALADETVNDQTDHAWQKGLTEWKRLSEIEGVTVPGRHIRVFRDGEEIGQFSVKELNRALSDGTVENLTDYAWHKGLSEWKRPTEIEGVSEGNLSSTYSVLEDYLRSEHPTETLEAAALVKEGPGNIVSELFLGPVAQWAGTRSYLFGITRRRITLMPVAMNAQVEEVLIGRIRWSWLSGRLTGDCPSALRFLYGSLHYRKLSFVSSEGAASTIRSALIHRPTTLSELEQREARDAEKKQARSQLNRIMRMMAVAVAMLLLIILLLYQS